MCGIAGARHEWLLQRGLEPEAVMRDAVAALAWRGPDGQQVVRIGDWWLGCARLAIGPAASSQPVVRRGGRFAGVLNGAITNARELWARLLPGVERRAVLPNDAWLPLLAVERGERALLHTLRGHHAYAVVDRATGELVFGQDRHGEKPLVCLHGRTEAGRTLHAFASTAVALTALGIPRVLRPRRMADWFRCGFHESLPHRLPGQHALDGPDRGLPLLATAAPRNGWHRPATDRPPAAGPDHQPLREALVAAVGRCVDTRVPVALLLSGGVDSSCLAASLRALQQPLPAYQFHAEGTPLGERDVARDVAAHCGLTLHPVNGGAEVLDALPQLTAMAGVPLGDPSVLALYATARAAAADGVRVVLGGEGADELFLGYRRYRALAWLPDLRWLRRLAPRWSMHYAARGRRAATAPDPWLALLAVTPPAFGAEILAPGLARQRCWRDDSVRRRRARGAHQLLDARQRDLINYLRLDLLPKVDTATMAAGIEARCPFLDGCLPIADSTRDLGKRLLRTAFADELPPIVFRQPKRGFALPLDRWFRGELPWLDVLAEPRTRQRPHLRAGGLAAIVDRHRSRRSNLGHGLYLLLAYELFLRAQEQESATGRTKTRTGA
jgi:asparagine synthase (glutamine-hydrolysing)